MNPTSVVVNSILQLQRKYSNDGMVPTLEAVNTRIYRDWILKKGIVSSWVDQLDPISQEELALAEDTVRCSPIDGRYQNVIVKDSDTPNTPDDAFRREDVSEPFVTSFSDGSVLGPSGLGIVGERPIADTVSDPWHERRRLEVAIASAGATHGIRSARRRLFSRSSSTCGSISASSTYEAVTPIVPQWKNYFHWTVECLLRVRPLEAYAQHTGIRPTLLIPASPADWMIEGLNAVGWAGHTARLREPAVHASTLVVPSHPEPTPADCQWLQEMFGVADKQGTERIFISRNDATLRRIVNESSVKNVLTEYNIRPVVLSDMTVHEQASLFAQASLIIAPHGAGLTNCVFSTNATVIELYGQKKSTTFQRIAEVNGLKYRRLRCQPQRVDLRVNTNMLEEVIKETITSLEP
ncbi:glycosyltransferase family 61 protein [Natrarchaeobaculum sulfurireducens]|uniref:Glycosyltransferase 61 catalytic domain-containing protein n=1 Tax=Natrarchaeobaculum sulfurireducens TaxID=2044521 RepID=A0A346PCE7_9EURY|nr:glycosyltransferase family 61 protein [Natrarchaeobaculum sulfurireducens]AXR77192.1 hypothetical protein AArc1_0850 [Natrarchaeobaculum sulfurireducens]